MSELFDEDPRDTVQERPPGRVPRARHHRRRARAGLLRADHVRELLHRTALVPATSATARSSARLLWTRVGLFLVFGAVMAAVVALNIVIAFRLRPLFHPPSPEQTGLDRYRQAVTPIRTWLVVGIAVLLGIFAGTSGAGEWRNYLLWRNSVPFEAGGRRTSRRTSASSSSTCRGTTTSIDFVMAVTVVALLAAAVVHYLYGGIRLQTAGRPAVRRRAGAAVGAARRLRARQGTRLLARPLRPRLPVRRRC